MTIKVWLSSSVQRQHQGDDSYHGEESSRWSHMSEVGYLFRRFAFCCVQDSTGLPGLTFFVLLLSWIFLHFSRTHTESWVPCTSSPLFPKAVSSSNCVLFRQKNVEVEFSSPNSLPFLCVSLFESIHFYRRIQGWWRLLVQVPHEEISWKRQRDAHVCMGWFLQMDGLQQYVNRSQSSNWSYGATGSQRNAWQSVIGLGRNRCNIE